MHIPSFALLTLLATLTTHIAAAPVAAIHIETRAAAPETSPVVSKQSRPAAFPLVSLEARREACESAAEAIEPIAEDRVVYEMDSNVPLSLSFRDARAASWMKGGGL